MKDTIAVSNHIYDEEHAFLDREYLDKGHESRTKLEYEQEQGDLTQEQFNEQLGIELAYSWARIPKEFWDSTLRMRVQRTIGKEIFDYTENNTYDIKELGLGLTLLGGGIGYKTQSLYVAGGHLVRRGFKCFILLFDELVFFIKETWNNPLLKKELYNRLYQAEFFFLVEIPPHSDVSASVMQDLLGLLELRQNSSKPCILSANVAVTSFNEIDTGSFIGRILLPFVRVNKGLIVDEAANVDDMYQDRWRLIDG